MLPRPKLRGGVSGARKSDVHVLSQAYGRWQWKTPGKAGQGCTGAKPEPTANHVAWGMNVRDVLCSLLFFSIEQLDFRLCHIQEGSRFPRF